MRRGVLALIALACLPAAAPAGAAVPPPRDDVFVLHGVGKAHGLGMAMDGVEGQARAGWSHDRILDLFYPGTQSSTAGGTVRVGLADGGTQRFVLPGGGTVLQGRDRRPVPEGATVTVTTSGGGAAARIDAAAATPQPSPSASPEPPGESPAAATLAGSAPQDPADAIESPPPVESPPSAPIDDPTPTPPPARDQPTSPGPAATPVGEGSVRIRPDGDPAVTLVEATGRRYRGEVEVLPVNGTLQVVNLVDLETYVAGIAEEKNAGWPLEGMKVLAIAARSLAAATMDWYAKSHDRGYHICATQNCQVYLGYDGEEPVMRRATQETAGRIRTYNGRPILAMYHGNGGGQTETYRKVARISTDPHPYLRSVRYPHADPSTWRRELTEPEIVGALAARGITVPTPITRIEVLERGDSPRVIQMRIHAGTRHVDMTGTTFMMALDLWSTWFDVGRAPAGAPAGTADISTAYPGADLRAVPGDAQSLGFLFVLAVAVLALAVAVTLQLMEPRLRPGLPRLRPRLRVAPSPPAS